MHQTINQDLKPLANTHANSRKTLQICGVCGETIEFENADDSFTCDCKCVKNRKIAAIMNKFRSLSLIGRRYENATFENSQIGMNISFDTAFNRCKKYCKENMNKCLKPGKESTSTADLAQVKHILPHVWQTP